MTTLFSSGGRVLACSLIGLFAFVPFALAENKCQGEPQTHTIGNFQFETYSWMEPAEPLNRYYTCVFNTHDEIDLKVSWYIPGPWQHRVPPGVGAPHPRRDIDASGIPINGCLEYGYLGDKTVAEFIGTELEENATASQSEKECRESVGLPMGAGIHEAAFQPEKGWSDSVTLYMPSDTKNEHDSLLQIDATYGVDYVGDSQFVTFFHYTAQQYEGREKGSPDDLSYVVISPELLAKHGDPVAALETAPEPVTLGIAGKYVSDSVIAERAVIAPTLVWFLDRNGELVSLIEIASVRPASQ